VDAGATESDGLAVAVDRDSHTCQLVHADGPDCLADPDDCTGGDRDSDASRSAVSDSHGVGEDADADAGPTHANHETRRY
jgi:hypothetical protein